MRIEPKRLLAHVLVLTLLAAAWEWGAQRGLLETALFGRPSGIAAYLRQALPDPRLWRDLAYTLGGTLIAFGVGSACAMALGLAFVAWPPAERALKPYLHAANALPRLALAPLFLLWFGLGVASKVAVGASLSFFVVLSATLAGIRGVAPDHVMLARSLGATPRQMFFRFTLPSAMPTLFAGLRLGLTVSLLGVVAAEIVAAEHGMGQRLAALQGGFDTNGVMGVLVLLALLGLGLSALMSLIERRLTRWQ
jgi:NitT/TauT family transport system permease protein